MTQENNMEKIIEQIRKLLALAGNNPSQQEAISAALKAQAMMAKYGIEKADVEDDSVKAEEINTEYAQYADGHTMTNWKLYLAAIISKNFRVKTYCSGSYVVFYGHKTDTQIAKEVFCFLAKIGNKEAVREYNKVRKEHRPTSGLMNTFLKGFVKGVADVLEKQCVALMIVTPQDVEDAYKEHSKKFRQKTFSCGSNGSVEAYSNGRAAGVSAANARAIEG